VGYTQLEYPFQQIIEQLLVKWLTLLNV
jgi:hypothetical protein